MRAKVTAAADYPAPEMHKMCTFIAAMSSALRMPRKASGRLWPQTATGQTCRGGCGWTSHGCDGDRMSVRRRIASNADDES